MYLGAWLWQLLSVLAIVTAADWGDWIIVDEAEAGTSVLLRRITPKSVFVAPTFGCSEGYRQDSLGRCVKHVKVNQAEQWKFYLERLNSMYAPASSSKKPQKEAGPFHISLPLGSDNSQGDVVVKKRLPPVVTQSTTSTTSRVTTTTTAKTTTTTVPPTTVQETTTQEATQPTMVELSETISTEKESNPETEITTETRKKYETTEGDSAVMLGDQPVGTETPSVAENTETPKNLIPASSQLPEKPFVIIVTNEPTTPTEETTLLPPAFTPPATVREEEDTTSEPSTSTEVTTEGTTDTTLKYTTDSNARPTEYDERFSEIRDIAETSIRPNVRYTSTSTIRPKCDTKSDVYGSSDCDPAETEIISHKRVVVNPSVPMPSNLPLLESNNQQVRFPSESFIPPRKSQAFVRFPESTHPHDDRPGLWWPSWHLPQHPGIRGWPPPEDPPSEQIIRKQFPSFPHHQPHPHSHPHPHSGQTWSDPNAWRRRFFQRD